jgi:hypothetical protein
MLLLVLLLMLITSHLAVCAHARACVCSVRACVRACADAHHITSSSSQGRAVPFQGNKIKFDNDDE